MRTLSIDLETYSSVDIGNCGAYKYVDSDDFEILLFGYSIDGAPADCYDLASGEELPQEIIDAMLDPTVTKTAYNAPFERTCLAKYFGKPMPPEQWMDTMILAAYCGLPLSLKNCGAALGLPEDKAKLKTGTELIRYFCCPCKPSKANGGRTRNMPTDNPEKWELFKEYNRRDVDVENTIRSMLLKWKPDKTEHKFWCLDQQINDRGIKVDVRLATNAISIGETYKEELLKRAEELSGLENPNSVSQIKDWLKEQEGIEALSLNKKSVDEVMKQIKGDNAKEFMELRKEFSKSSTKKYDSILRCVCKDQHIHGIFQFYGANRTGRFCLTADHEVLTKNGWKRIDEWGGGKIAVWDKDTESISFENSEQVSFDYDGDMYTYIDKRIDQCSTPDHKMRVKRRRDKDWEDMTVEEMVKHRPSIPFFGLRKHDVLIDSDRLRVLVMTQADGCFNTNGTVTYHFHKRRKLDRCKELLTASEIEFNVYREEQYGPTVYISARNVPNWLRAFDNKTFGAWIFDSDADVFFDELIHWDGHEETKNSIQYCTTNKTNADYIQAFAHMSGRAAIVVTKHWEKKEKYKNYNTAYYVDICKSLNNSHEICVKPSVNHFVGKVYCAVTKTGYFLVRRNGKVWVTGNSGRLVQCQNLPQNHMEDLDTARMLVRNGDIETVECLYPDVQSALSELIRTSLIPEDGHKFIVCDFSAIEARCLAYAAGEQWRIDLFKSGGDIYCQSASRMFHVPVEKHGVNGHLRQRGKVAELGLGYAGGVGAMKAFGADKLGMSEEEMAQTVQLWRDASPHIVAFWASMGKAMKQCIQKHVSTISTVGGVLFEWDSGNVFMNLPSGRRLCYWGACLTEDKWGRPSIGYMSQNQTTKKWELTETFSGKIVENYIQAFARDCLRETMFRLNDAGFDVRAHVHDEVIITEPIDGRGVEDVEAIFKMEIPWAKGLPLVGSGYTCPSYRKD